MERNCQSCKYYKDGYCEDLELEPKYPDVGCDDFEIKVDKNAVLDKIRAEIETLNPVDYVSMSSYEGHRGASDMKDDVLDIIDKYKVKSEAGK